MKRVDWIDVAKGLAIILIVMFHARDYALSLIPPSPDIPLRWVYIDPLLRYIRLPLFFLLSGMLASGSFSASSGPPRYTVRRTGVLAGVYVLWSVPLLILVPDWPRDGWRMPADAGFVLEFLRGGSVIWYLWAVVAAFGFAWVTRALPPLVAVILAAGIGLALLLQGDALGGSMRPLGRCLPYYILGIRFPFALLWLARWRSASGLTVLVCAYVIAMSIRPDFDGLNPIRETLGIAMAVVAICWGTDRWPRVARRLGWLGRRTLPVYIFHFPLLALIGSAAVRHRDMLVASPLTLPLFLPLLSVTVIALSLGLFVLMQAAGLGWTLAMPRRARERRASVEATPLVRASRAA